MYASPDPSSPAAPRSFTAEDRARFAALKERLRRRLGPRPDSRAVYEAAQIMAEIGRDGLHCIDEQTQLAYWCYTTFTISHRQVEKYLRVAQVLTEQDLTNPYMGIEALDQLALAPPELRYLVLQWTDEYTAGALAAGRLAAVAVWKRSSLEQAERAFKRAMRARADQEMERSKERKARKQLPPPQRLVGALQRCVADLERVLTNDPSPAELALLREQLHRLIELDPHFALRPATSPPAEMLAEAPRAQAALPRSSKATLLEAPLPETSLGSGEPQAPAAVGAPEGTKMSQARKEPKAPRQR